MTELVLLRNSHIPDVGVLGNNNVPRWAGLLASGYLQNPETSAGFNPKAASDWSVVIISSLPPSLTGSRGEYLRVVGILGMVE